MACCPLVIQPNDLEAHCFPVSVKGVLLRDGRVVLVGNSRGEWELPGGKLERDESPETCVAREIHEELGLVAEVGPLLDAWIYPVRPDVLVLVLAYGCELAEPLDGPLSSPEGAPVLLQPVTALHEVALPRGYHRAIARWATHVASEDGAG